jgi:hypothetical protein
MLTMILCNGRAYTYIYLCAWQEPARSNYLQFLVDSLVVYEGLEEIVATYPALASLKNTGLERGNVRVGIVKGAGGGAFKNQWSAASYIFSGTYVITCHTRALIILRP